MRFTWASHARVNRALRGTLNGQMNNVLEMPMNAHRLRTLALAGVAGGAVLLLGGCVVAPPAYGTYPAYGEAAVVAPAVVAPPVSIGIGVGGYWGGGPRYYGRPGYWGRGYWR